MPLLLKYYIHHECFFAQDFTTISLYLKIGYHHILIPEKKFYFLSFLSVPFSNQIHSTLLNLSSHIFNYHLDSNAFPNCKTGQQCVKCN